MPVGFRRAAQAPTAGYDVPASGARQGKGEEGRQARQAKRSGQGCAARRAEAAEAGSEARGAAEAAGYGEEEARRCQDRGLPNARARRQDLRDRRRAQVSRAGAVVLRLLGHATTYVISTAN